MLATKEQERKALEKIRKIVSDLGDNSYLSMAFDGCFEIAESNIDNDFGDSPKENLKYAESQIKDLESRIEQLSEDNKALQACFVPCGQAKGLYKKLYGRGKSPVYQGTGGITSYEQKSKGMG